MVAYVLNAKPSDDMVEKVTDRLAEKVYTEEFNTFVSNEKELTANYAQEVRNKKLFFDLCKNADRPKMVENSKMNHLLKYHRDCIRENVMPLPILFKIRNRRLVLKGYRLNDGLCQSLKHACKVDPDLLTSIKLQDNGISDYDMSQVMAGLGCLENLKQIWIESNIFLGESCE